MRSVIIATANSKLNKVLENLLLSVSIKPLHIVKSAAELFALGEILNTCVVIMGFLKDIPAIYAARTLSSGADVILLLDSNSPVPYYVSNITIINLPIQKRELAEIIGNLCGTNFRSFGTKTTAKKARNEEETQTIERAKRIIMQKRGISEGDAHKLLQKYAMNSGISLIESAKYFLNNS